jgi:LysM repeat protein
MQKKVFLFSVILYMVLLNSCRTTKPIATRQYASGDEQSYIDNYSTLAINEMKRTGVPASITLAQALIESDAGQSDLAKRANNHFGIKCHDNWTGPSVRHNDDRRNECFRKYTQPEGSYRDHSDFLKKEVRYKSLFSLDPQDYKAWAKGLKKAGYATNPDYANMLIRKIEQYGLDQYDSGKAGEQVTQKQAETVNKPDEGAKVTKPDQKDIQKSENLTVTEVPSRIRENNRIQYIIVKEGETKESIEKEFQLLGWELARYNELQSGFTITTGQILYLQPKREKAEAGKDIYIASDGDTMYSISQIYGIKLKSLLILNRMEAGQNPVAGQKIWLRTVKPAQ